MLKLVICGNYGATNLGDEAILDGILKLVRGVAPQAKITVMSANPADTRARHGVDSVRLFPAGPRSLLRGIFSGEIGRTFKALMECDAFILGGGGLLSDEKLMAMVIWPLQASFACLLRKPVFCLGQSVGPLRTFFGRIMAKRVYRRAMSSTVRDMPSQHLLHNLGLPKPPVLADPAFLAHAGAPLEATRENLVAFSIRKWPSSNPDYLYKSFAHMIDWLWSEYGFKSVLIPFSESPENDSDVLNNIFIHVKQRSAAELFEYSGDYGKVLNLFSKARVVVGMRLHSLIFASLTTTPFVAISYSSKVSGLCDSLEMGDYALDYGDVSPEKLKSAFTRLMTGYRQIGPRLAGNTLLLRGKAREHEELLKTFFSAALGAQSPRN